MDIDAPWRRHQALDPELGTSVLVMAGTRLMVEGAPGTEFFVIEHGHVRVERQGHEVAVLGPGEHFGEIAVLGPAGLRTASVIAADDLQVRVYDRREFATLLDRDPVLATRILRHAVERLLAA